MWDNPVDYYMGITEQFKMLNSYYNNNNKIKVIKNELCYIKKSLLFDDGG